VGVFIDNPLVVLFLVVAIGAAVGSIRVRGISLGPAGALFVGLAVSAFDDRLANTPAIVPQIGLALFIYTVGLASGPSFLAGLRHGGARVLAGAAAVIGAVALMVLAAASLLDLDVGARTGLFAGVLTNTPALSAAIEGLGGRIADGTVTDPVVGYSLAYPLGVLCMLLAADRVLRRAQGGAAAHDRRAALGRRCRDERDGDGDTARPAPAGRSAALGRLRARVLSCGARRAGAHRHHRDTPGAG
jgi:putative transport protein